MTAPKLRRRPGCPRSLPDRLQREHESVEGDSKRPQPNVTTERLRVIDEAEAELAKHNAEGSLAPKKGDTTFAGLRALWCSGHLTGPGDGVYDDERCREVVVDDARAGVTEAVLAAKIIIDDCNQRKLPLPPSLSLLVAELFQKMADGQNLPKCKNHVTNASRDLYIALTVHRIAQRHHPDYPATRAPENRHAVNGLPEPSASWIVSKALERLGIKLSQARVEGIYSANIRKLEIIAQTRRLRDLGFFS